MSVSSIGPSSGTYTTAVQQQAAVQGIGRERENDGDKDDGASAAQTPSPTVNMNGQTIGNIINIAA